MPKINKIREILEAQRCSFDTLGVFDLDNTVLRVTKVEDLGSDQWFGHVFKIFEQKTKSSLTAITHSVTLNDTLQGHLQVKPVEPNTIKIITGLTDVGLPVIALTSRGPGLVEITLQQLNAMNIKFTDTLYSKEIQLDIGETRRIATYKNGVIFCDGANKGICLMAFLRMINEVPQYIMTTDDIGKSLVREQKMVKYAPKHVMMVDDIEKNLMVVQEALEKEGIKFTGLHYTHLEPRVAGYDFQRSHCRLFDDLANKLPSHVAPLLEMLKDSDTSLSPGKLRVTN
jgi:hypothetical protein